MKTLAILLGQLFQKVLQLMDLTVEVTESHEPPHQRFRCQAESVCPFEGVWFPRNLRKALVPVCSHHYSLGIAEGSWSELDDRDNWNKR